MLLTNLLSNALKYGAQREKITVEIGMVKSKGVLKVKNRGEGVLAREKRKIWRRFYRGKEVGGEGLGIGLALVKEVADANGLTVSTGKDETGDFYVSISGFEVAGK
jgi:signal transduction histidine kinase